MSEETWAEVALDIEALGPFAGWEEAWEALPVRGLGWVMAPDRVTEFRPDAAHRFLAAEVAHGPVTVHVRHDGDGWRAWRYTERVGDTHRKREHVFEGVSSRRSHPPGRLRYAEYWGLEPDPFDDEVTVWTPVVARFIGFDRGGE